LPAEIFEAPINVDLMHQAYVRQMANARLGTHSTKTRSEVRGGGRKPWRQKGTGRARQGSIRSAQWVGGGKIHTPSPRIMTRKCRAKCARLPCDLPFQPRLQKNPLLILEELSSREKTRLMAEAVKRLLEMNPVLMVNPLRRMLLMT
jgi:large subunit ribosomal protein L4